MDQNKLISEARARIIWGESSRSVRDFLISNGISATAADVKINEFNLERNSEIRNIGTKDVFVGLVLTCATGVTSYIIISNRASVIFSRALGLVFLAGLYGLWKLLHGLIYLIRPQSVHSSIPDIIGSDILE